MKNLLKVFDLDRKNKRLELVNGMNEHTTAKELLAIWYYRHFLTPAKLKTAEFLGLDQLKELILKSFDKETEKNRAQFESRIKHVLEAKDVERINITIEWVKSRTWGANPRGTAHVRYTDGTGETFICGGVSGCGYDKESTAVANCVNQINGVLKALFIKKEKQAKKTNREVFGYGSGYGILPQLEGGVGVSCYPEIFNKIGFKFQGVSHGKTFDVYEIVKK